MKKGIFWSLAVVGTMIFASCGGEAEEVEQEAPLEICIYKYNNGSSEFSWTAYKTTAKVAVGGTFNEIEITGDQSSDDAVALIESMKFSMNTESVETNNVERNGKIANLFFGVINTPTIDGSVKKLKDDGKAVIEVTMNGVSADVEGDYSLVDGKFSFNTSVDVSIWNAMLGIETLNEACYDLHSGDDGVSKLWTEVALSFSTQLESDCD
ncbi:MAG: YceI family protein [Crocinitomicaceae bacterium]|nr:YceI family protein [Crocinitomicaceae bacterium]